MKKETNSVSAEDQALEIYSMLGLLTQAQREKASPVPTEEADAFERYYFPISASTSRYVRS